MSAPTATPHAAPVDEHTASLLALIDGDPVHAADRAVIVGAITQTARDNGGEVCPNRLRVLLTDAAGEYVVYPRVVGAVVASLSHRGVLIETGWVVTTGSPHGNNGKQARAYHLRTP